MRCKIAWHCKQSRLDAVQGVVWAAEWRRRWRGAKVVGAMSTETDRLTLESCACAICIASLIFTTKTLGCGSVRAQVRWGLRRGGRGGGEESLRCPIAHRGIHVPLMNNLSGRQ